MRELTVLDRHELGDDLLTIHDSDFPVHKVILHQRGQAVV